jgi:tagatose-1,6-bisphosphate aldolase non-catalytic subunit AgaZ/GatZ
MKTIQPVTVWFNGQEQQATLLSAYVSADNLLDRASFAYQLLEEEVIDGKVNLIAVASGYLGMTGADYDAWETNEYAYDWVAAQLNLTITGDYVPPVPPQPEPTPEPTRTLPEVEETEIEE